MDKDSRMSKISHRFCGKCKKEKNIEEFYRSGRGNTSWCKDCMRELSKQRVKDGRDRKSKLKYNEKHHVKERRKLTELEFTAYEIYRNAFKRSLYLQREIDITREWVTEKLIEFCSNNYYQMGKGKLPFKPSLDRIDNSKGYTKENVKIVWTIENYCKNTFSNDDVIEFCKRKLKIIS